jgi:hypothetical protein
VSVEEQQRQARERWREYQLSKNAGAARGQEATRDKEQTEEREKRSDRGIDDDLSL